MAEEHREPRVTPRATPLDGRIRRGFEVVQSLLLYSVALLLVVFAVLALLSAVLTFGQHVLGDHDYPYAISQGIDTAFLTIILVELLHTVLSRGPIGRQVQEFLVIGITSAVRYSLEITASNGRSAHAAPATIGSARDVVINLAINAAGVLLLVAALWLVRRDTGRSGNKGPDSAG